MRELSITTEQLRWLQTQFAHLSAGAEVYLDHAATTPLPVSVQQAVLQYWQQDHANAHRGQYPRATRATEIWEYARGRAAQFIGVPAEQVALVASTTFGLNQLAQIAIPWQAGDEILLSEAEHHANFLPWQRLAEQYALQLKFIPLCTQTGQLQFNPAQVSARTKLVSLHLKSNVTGIRPDVAAIFSVAKAAGAWCFVDAAQAASDGPLRAPELGADALVFSGHKTYGGMGAAALYLTDELAQLLPPLTVGGGMVTQVTLNHARYTTDRSRYEAGSPNVAAALGLACGLDWLAEAQRLLPADYLSQLHTALLAGLSQRGFVCLPSAAPIVSAWHPRVHALDLALMLGEQGICVRAGSHCAQPLLQKFQLDSVVRFSLGWSNVPADIATTLAAIDAVLALLEEST